MSIYQRILNTQAGEDGFSCMIRHKGGSSVPSVAAPSAPPPEAENKEVQMRRREMLKNTANRRGIKSTLLNDAGSGNSLSLGNNTASRPRGTLLGG